jgi:hypothetical protein
MTRTYLLISLLFILITAWSVSAQTSGELRTRLGIPVTEVFRPDKGISVTTGGSITAGVLGTCMEETSTSMTATSLPISKNYSSILFGSLKEVVVQTRGRDAVFSAAIAADKMQLLRGPTHLGYRSSRTPGCSYDSWGRIGRRD